MHERVPELDLLRFCAALAVTLFHLTEWPAEATALSRLAAFGFLGVPLFFTISGFVILMTAQGRTGMQFVTSRAARLYPTFWVCVLLTSCVLVLWGRNPPSLAELAANLTMLPRALFDARPIDGVYWSLVVEMKFYALVLLAIVSNQLRRIELWLAVWLVAALLAAAEYAPHWLRSATLHPWGSLFIAGCYLYLIRTRGSRMRLVLPFCASVCVSVLCAVGYQHLYTLSEAPAFKLAVAGLVVALNGLFFCVAIRAWPVPRLRLWFWLGCLTYPLYLLHARAGKAIWSALPGDEWLRVWFVLAVVLLVALVLAATVERSVCKAFDRFLDLLAGRAVRSARALLRARATGTPVATAQHQSKHSTTEGLGWSPDRIAP